MVTEHDYECPDCGHKGRTLLGVSGHNAKCPTLRVAVPAPSFRRWWLYFGDHRCSTGYAVTEENRPKAMSNMDGEFEVIEVHALWELQQKLAVSEAKIAELKSDVTLMTNLASCHSDEPYQDLDGIWDVGKKALAKLGEK